MESLLAPPILSPFRLQTLHVSWPSLLRVLALRRRRGRLGLVLLPPPVRVGLVLLPPPVLRLPARRVQ
eukprot:4570021-Prymnesium_polylepis.1